MIWHQNNFSKRFICIVLTLFFAFNSGFSQSVDLTRLEKLKGTWKMEKKNGAFYETWKQSVAVFYGKSYKINHLDTLVLESVRIFNDGETLIYAPTVKNQNDNQEVRFYLKNTSGNVFIFENLKHDYPQRVAYDLSPGDSLHAYIEGVVNGKMKRSDFHYKRQK